MTSRNELILQRLEAIMTEEYVSATTVVRNRALVREDVRPAIAILDGDERAILTGDSLGRGRGGRVALAMQLMTMSPQIFFLPKELLPMNVEAEGSERNIGTIVNAYADMIVRVIAQDAELRELVGNNGSIAFMGKETDLKSGGSLQGQCRLDFALTYLYDPTEPLS